MIPSAQTLQKPFGETTSSLSNGVVVRAVLACVVLIGLGILSQFDFLFFHMLAEISTVVVSLLVFTIALGTYRFTGNNYLLIVGCGYFWVALFDLFHALAYKGMGFEAFSDANLATQLWVTARLFEAGTLLFAPFFLSSKIHLRPSVIMAIFGWLAMAVVALLVTQLFPDAYIEGEGLTPLKIATERVIVLLLLGAGAGLIVHKGFFTPRTWWTLLAALLLSILTELTFTAYFTLTGPLNIMGHLTKVLSFWLVFEAIVGAMLSQPFDTLARTIHSFDAIPAPVMLVDQSGVVLQSNQAALEWFDLPRQDLVGSLIRDLFHTPAAPAVGLLKDGGQYGGPLLKSLRTLTPVQGVRVFDKGQRRLCLVSTSLFHGHTDNTDDGVLILYLQDITAQEQADTAVTTLTQRLEAALSSNEAGLWDWSVTTGDVFFTPTMETMLGYEVGEWEPSVRSWEQRIHPDDRATVLGDLQAHLEGTTSVYDNTHRMRHKDGQWVRIRDRGVVVERDGMGRALRAIGTHVRAETFTPKRDVSSDELAETLSRVALTAQQGVGEPLRAAMQFLRLLQRSTSEPLAEGQRNLIEQALQHGLDASAVLRSLVAYGLNEASPLELGMVHYESLLRPLIEALQPKGQKVPWAAFEQPLLAVRADRRHVEGALSAILRALQSFFLPEQPQKVRIQSWKSGEQVVLELAAYHVTLPPDYEKTLFVPTAALPPEDPSDIFLMTLGMALQSVRRMGGDLTVLTQQGGKETVLFRLQLPGAAL